MSVENKRAGQVKAFIKNIYNELIKNIYNERVLKGTTKGLHALTHESFGP